MISSFVPEGITTADEALCKKCNSAVPPTELPEMVASVDWVECERCATWFHALC